MPASGDPVVMAHQPWTTYRQRIAAGARLILPCGAIEQHGPHLPLGVDHLLSSATAADVARVLMARGLDCMVGPGMAYGCKSQAKMGGGQRFPGTTSLDAHTFACQMRDVLREWYRHGARRVIVLNGHYENQMVSLEGIDLARREHPDLIVMRLEYWDFTPTETLARIFPDGFPGYALEHAAVLETSMMLHHHPELVHLDAIPNDLPADFPPYDLHPQPEDFVPASGVLSSARNAKAEYGAALAADYARLIADAIARVFPG